MTDQIYKDHNLPNFLGRGDSVSHKCYSASKVPKLIQKIIKSYPNSCSACLPEVKTQI